MATPIPSNSVAFSIEEIAGATGGQVVLGKHTAVTGVATDTRADVGGKLFVALEGERFDGHQFVPQAVAAGAAAVLVRRELDVAGVSVVRVADTLVGLGALARLHRRRWGGRIVAIGGSAGKTTTRAAVAAALEALAPGAVHSERGNLNNRVGVPFVLFGLAAKHRFGVVEIGTNVRGEVADLAAVSEPDVALLTLVGMEHAEGIGDLDDIEAEEGDLLRSVGAAGIAIANGDDPRARRQLEASRAGRKATYGTGADADYRVVERDRAGVRGAALRIRRPDGVEMGVTSPLVGEPGALAVAAAVATACELASTPLDADALASAFGAVAEPGRLSPVELVDGTLLLDDTYNANPASVRASIATASEIAEARRARLVLVLGEMRELGRLSVSEHRAIAKDLGSSRAALVVGVAGDAREFVDAQTAVPATFADDADDALAIALDRVEAGDVVLVKASRGVAAERVVRGLVEARGGAS